MNCLALESSDGVLVIDCGITFPHDDYGVDVIHPLFDYLEDTPLWIKDQAVCLKCADKPCLAFCPVAVYRVDKQGHTMVGYQACVECGSCRVGCPFHNIGWTLPRGGNGVAYKFG